MIMHVHEMTGWAGQTLKALGTMGHGSYRGIYGAGILLQGELKRYPFFLRSALTTLLLLSDDPSRAAVHDSREHEW